MKDRVILIVGAAGGVGSAVARELARAGARLVLADLGCDATGVGRSEEPVAALAAELQEAGAEVVHHCGDVRDAGDVAAWVTSAEARFGRLDGVVETVAILAAGRLGQVDDDQWERLVGTRLGGVRKLLRGAVPALRRAGGGSIVLSSGRAGYLGGHGESAAAAADGGVHALMRSASIELQRLGVRVNAVAPLCKTRLTEHLPIFEKMTSLSPEHAAPAYSFLLSDAAAELSGVVLAVAGGKLTAFRFVESRGRYKEVDGGLWTPQEIAEHWEAIERAERA